MNALCEEHRPLRHSHLFLIHPMSTGATVSPHSRPRRLSLTALCAGLVSLLTLTGVLAVSPPPARAETEVAGQAADQTLLDEGETVCCYARSEKHWVTDPQGIAWEHFQTLDGAVPVYGQPKSVAKTESACCTPGAARRIPVNVSVKSTGACC